MNTRNLLKIVAAGVEGGMPVLTKVDGNYSVTFIDSKVFEKLPITKKVVKEIDDMSEFTIRRDLSHLDGLLFVEKDKYGNIITEGGDKYVFVKTYVHRGLALYVKDGSDAANILERRVIKVHKQNRFQHFEQLNAKVIHKCSKQFKAIEKYNVVSVKFEKEKGDNDNINPRYRLAEKSVVAFGNNNVAEVYKASNKKVATYVGGINITKEAKNLISEILLVTLDRDIINNIKLSVNQTVFIPRRKDDIIIELDEGRYYSTVKAEFVDRKKTWMEFYPAVYSNSSIKDGAAYFIKVDDKHSSWIDTIKELIPDFEEELKASGKTKDTKLSREQKRRGVKVDSHEIDSLEAAKLFSRPSLGLTGAVRMGDLPGIAIYQGTFIPEDKDGVSPSDGAGFHINEEMAPFFNITPDEMQKLVLQDRTRQARDKQVTSGMSRECGEYLIAQWEKEDKVRIIGDRNHIAVILDKNCVKLKGNGSADLDFKLLNIAESGDGALSIQMATKPVFAAAKDGKLDEIVNYLSDLGKQQLIDKVEEAIAETTKDAKLGSTHYVDVLRQTNSKNPILKNAKFTEIQNSCKLAIQKIKFDANIEFGMFVPDRAATITGGKYELLQHDKKKIEVFYGKYSTMIGDKKFYLDRLQKKKVTALYNNDNELVAEIREKMAQVEAEIKELQDKFGEATMYKYPSASHIECIKVELVDSYELAKRAEAMQVDDALKRGIIDGIINASPAAIMMPNDPQIMGLLAGFDFDGDDGFMCFDKKINSYIAHNYRSLVLDKVAKGKKVMHGINKNLINEMLSMQLLLDDSVGMVTNEFTTILMLLIDMLNGSKKAYRMACRFLNESIGAKNVKVEKDYYQSPKDRTISPKFIDAIMTEIMSVEWTEENVKAFLLDCCLVGRFYQESIIDAAKTGVFFKRFIKCATIHLSSRQPIVVNKETKELERVPFETHNEDGTRKYKNIYVDADSVVASIEGVSTFAPDRKAYHYEYEDVFARIQNALMDVYNNVLLPKLEASFEEYKYSSEDMRKMNAIFSELNKGDSEDLLALMNCKSAYSILMHDKIKAINNADDEEAITAINEAYDVFFNALANNVSDVFDNISENYRELNTFEKGALLLAVSIYDKNDKTFRSDSSNRFAYVVDMTSTIAFLSGSEDGIYRTYGSILHDEGRVEDGAIITLDRGIDVTNGIICESTYTGTAIYVNDGEETYLIQEKSISELFNENNDNENRLVVVDTRRVEEGDIFALFEKASTTSKLFSQDGEVGVYIKEGKKYILDSTVECSSMLVDANALGKVKGKIAVAFTEGKAAEYCVFLITK